MKHLKILIILLSFLQFTACKEVKKERDGLLKIVCTTGMLGDAAKNIVGDKAEVISLMGPGVDPHLYKASQGDLKKLLDADVIIYNGLHLEGKMTEVFDKLKKQKFIIEASDAIEEKDLINNTSFQGAHDPHIWFDASLWASVVLHIGEQLADHLEEKESSQKELFLNNANAYQAKLLKLHKQVRLDIQEVEPDKRVLITAHDAFAYFGRAYDIEVKGLQGISTVSEYGLKDVSNLVNFIIERKIQAVFIESSVSERSLKAVVEGCNSQNFSIEIGGTLYSDAMGEPESKAGNYIGMFETNVSTIVNALK